MLSELATLLILYFTLVAVAIYAVVASRTMKVEDATSFLSAKNSVGAVKLGWCFFASGIGSWTLFSFPEIGAEGGIWGIIGYTTSCAFGYLILAVVGPASRNLLGEGITWSDYILNRYSRVLQGYVALIALFYQFISISSEFTGIGDLVVLISPSTDPIWAMIGVAILTNVYILVGGLRASLATDVWQGIGVLLLVLIVCIAMFFFVDIPSGSWSSSGIATFTVSGFEAFVVLNISIISSNLFLTGFWQRVWAAKDDRTLRISCVLACCMIVPFTVALAMSGMVSELAYPGQEYFFSILLNMGKAWSYIVLICVGALSSSTVDNMQLGMAAEASCFFKNFNIHYARVVGMILNVPAIIIAKQGYDILTLFLIADLLCTATVGPMLLGAWKRSHPTAALIGCISGLLSIFVYGAIADGSFVGGFKNFALPDGTYSFNSMMTFIVALIVPVIVTVALSLVLPPVENKNLIELNNAANDRASYHSAATPSEAPEKKEATSV